MNMLEPVLVLVISLLLVMAVEVCLLTGAPGEPRRQAARARMLMWVVLALALASFAVLLGAKP